MMVTVDSGYMHGYKVSYPGTRFSVQCETLEAVNQAVAHHFAKCSKNGATCPTCKALDERNAKYK